jgi:hypothetical protein
MPCCRSVFLLVSLPFEECAEEAGRDRHHDACPCGHCQEQLKLETSLFSVLQILEVTLFEKTFLFFQKQNPIT